MEACPAKFLTSVSAGDVLQVRLAGGGGHGDARLRDPAAVLEDVREGKLTVAHARAGYGVVLVGDPLRVDRTATLDARKG